MSNLIDISIKKAEKFAKFGDFVSAKSVIGELLEKYPENPRAKALARNRSLSAGTNNIDRHRGKSVALEAINFYLVLHVDICFSDNTYFLAMMSC